MKKLIFYGFFVWRIVSVAQNFEVETIKYSGDTANRINLVILSEGYQTHELSNFITQAEAFSNEMFSASPFKEYADYFNVYAIKVPSNESGADHPSDGIIVDTFFNATYDAFGIPRLLYYEIDGNSANNTEAKILSVLADNFPNYDQALILVNDPEYGGSGGNFPMSYNGEWGTEVIMHELGHSLFDLKDEYYPGDLLAAEAVNMTMETDPSKVRWKNWLNINNVGIYQYNCATGNCEDWYKPHQNSIMEFLNQNFGAVNKEAMVLKIHDLVSSVDAYSPNENSLDNPDFPLDLDLALVKPNPNTLNISWTLNGEVIANNLETFTLQSDNQHLVEGTNTLVAVISDTSEMLRLDDPNSGSHISTVTWLINVNALKIDDITSKTQNYNVTIYPNPVESIANFKIESNTFFDLTVTLTTIDGKHIQDFELNSTNTNINIAHLNKGVYLANLYASDALITSKTLIKK